jgi:hypothetical protein
MVRVWDRRDRVRMKVFCRDLDTAERFADAIAVLRQAFAK